MTPETFTQVLDSRINKIMDVLDAKAKEYAPGTDRLHNFKRAAAINSSTPINQAWNFATKHLVSILDMKEDPTKYSLAQWDEKMGDMINYLILMEACVHEAHAAKKP